MPGGMPSSLITRAPSRPSATAVDTSRSADGPWLSQAIYEDRMLHGLPSRPTPGAEEHQSPTTELAAAGRPWQIRKGRKSQHMVLARYQARSLNHRGTFPAAVTCHQRRHCGPTDASLLQAVSRCKPLASETARNCTEGNKVEEHEHREGEEN